MENTSAKSLENDILQTKEMGPRLITTMDKSTKYMSMMLMHTNKSKEVQLW